MGIIDYKFRAVISEYDQNNLPETFTLKGKVFDSAEEAIPYVEELANAMYKDLTSCMVFHKGYDPLGYSIEKYNEYTFFIRHNKFIDDNNLGGCAKSFMYNTEVRAITCCFTDQVNKITYRSMELIQFENKWYVHSSINGSIIGVINENESLNKILQQADEIYDKLDSNHTVSAPQLVQNLLVNN